MSAIRWTVFDSPIGPLNVVASPKGLAELSFSGRRRIPVGAAEAPLPDVTDQLGAYFAGELRRFELALDLQGTPLEKVIWEALVEIPYGHTVSYGEQAEKIHPDLFGAEVEPWQRARVVGVANGRNPVSIVVPCHRVVGADGSLTGYGGGLERKRALLDLERRSVAPQLQLA